jgi:hypothetical protein
MSLIGGLVDAHRETELNPSTRLIRSAWYARHLWTIVVLAASASAGAYLLIHGI